MPLDTLHLILIGLLAAAIGLIAWVGGAQLRRLRADVDRLSRLNETGRVLLTDRNLRGVLRHVVETARRQVAADGAWVTLGQAGDRYVTLEAADGPLAPTVGSAMRAEGTTAGWVMTRAEALLLNAPPEDDRPFASLHQGVRLTAAAVHPLLAKGRCIGALGVENPRRSLTAQDSALLRELADYAALAIESLQAVEALSERERRAALTNAVNSRIRQSLDLPVILETAVRELGSALRVSRCFVRLGGPYDARVPAAEWSAPEVARLGTRRDYAEPFLRTALAERRTVAVADIRDEDEVRHSGDLPERALGVLVTPLILRGEAIGALAFHQDGLPRHWRAGDIGLVEEVAAELAIGIANARLYRSVEDASRELAQKIGELERANRLKAEFLANMSHELRTPLNSVIGFSELLLAGTHGPLSKEQHDALATIARNGRHLLDLVNDVLDLSKIDAGRMELRLTDVNLRSLLSDVLEGMASLVLAKGHALELRLGDDRLQLRADPMRLRQVLFNLLSNAVKFTPPQGRITVTGEACPDRRIVRLAVTDTGIGILADDLPQLFTEFTQLDASYARRYEGTGLGLALCRRLVEMHGGRIGVESAPRQGSTFWIELPVAGPGA